MLLDNQNTFIVFVITIRAVITRTTAAAAAEVDKNIWSAADSSRNSNTLLLSITPYSLLLYANTATPTIDKGQKIKST